MIFLRQNTRIRANFGARPFAFAEGQLHRDAADAANDLCAEMRESFSNLPFHTTSDDEAETNPPPSPEQAAPEASAAVTGPECKLAEAPKKQKGT